MKIRRATAEDDFDAIDCLQRLVLPYDDPCDAGLGVWWLMRCARGEPIAFAGMRMSSRWSDCMYLCRSGVAPDWRGRGIQKRLIAVRERHAKARGMAWLITDTTQNPASSNSLMARGFRLYEPAAPWGGRYTLYWRKRI